MNDPIEDGIKKYRVLLSVPTLQYVDARSLKEAKDRVTDQVFKAANVSGLPIKVVGIEWVGDNNILPEFIGGKFKGSRKV